MVGGQRGPTGGSSPQGPGTLASGDGESRPCAGRCSRRACGGQQSPRPGHTSLGGRGGLPRRWSVLKEGLRGAAVPKARAHQPGGTGSPAQVVVGAQRGPTRGSSPQGPGTPARGDGDSCPGGGQCSKRACGGQQFPKPGHTSLGGRGALPRWWSVLNEGLRGAVVPKARPHQPGRTGSRAQAVVAAQGGPAGGSSPQGPGTLGWGDGKSCPSGGRCSRRACGGQQSPRPGHTSLGGREVLPKRWSLLKEGLRGATVPKARAHHPEGTGSPAHVVVGAQRGLTRGTDPQGPGTPPWEDGKSCPSGGRCSRRACGGQQSPRPGHTSPGGRGVLPKRWSLLKEGLRGAAVPKARAH